MQAAIRLSVVVPVFRSAATLPELHRRVAAALAELPGGFELILVEDAGGDGSWEVMKQLRAADPRVRIVRLANNVGQHPALQCGLRLVRGELVGLLDDDLQNPPEELPRLIAALERGEYDLVFGLPEQRRHPGFRNLGSRVFRGVVALCFPRHRRVRPGNFMLVRRPVVDAVLPGAPRDALVGLLLLDRADRVGEVTVTHAERMQGASGYTLGRLARLFLGGLLVHGGHFFRRLRVGGMVSLGLGLLALVAGLRSGLLLVAGAGLAFIVAGLVTFGVAVAGGRRHRILREIPGRTSYHIAEHDA